MKILNPLHQFNELKIYQQHIVAVIFGSGIGFWVSEIIRLFIWLFL
jgi:hypothetical protein